MTLVQNIMWVCRSVLFGFGTIDMCRQLFYMYRYIISHYVVLCSAAVIIVNNPVNF